MPGVVILAGSLLTLGSNVHHPCWIACTVWFGGSDLGRPVFSAHTLGYFPATPQPSLFPSRNDMQVVTRLELAALCVRWSPCGRKFAMGSAACCVSVAYRDARNGWWTAKLMRRCHGSSVVAVAWHPGGALLATASSDGRCRVFDARVAGTRP